MREWQSQSHVRWYCKYHVVFVPKYRKRSLYGSLRRNIGKVLRELCLQHEVELVKGHAMVLSPQLITVFYFHALMNTHINSGEQHLGLVLLEILISCLPSATVVAIVIDDQDAPDRENWVEVS